MNLVGVMIRKFKKIHLLTIISVLLLGACSTVERSNLAEVKELYTGKKIEKKEPTAEEKRDLQVFLSMKEKLSTVISEVVKRNDQREINYLTTDLFLKASDSSIRGESQLAAVLYEAILKMIPEDLFIKKKYAIELIRIGDIAKSELILRDVLDKSLWSDESTALILGGVYTALKKSSEAEKVYKRILKNNPKNSEACLFLAKTYILKNQYINSERLLKKCEKEDSKNASYSYYIGKIKLSRKKRSIAIRYFKKSLRIDPAFYQSALILGLMYEEKEKYIAANRIYKRYLKSDPSNKEILGRLVQIMFLKEKSKSIIPYVEKLSSLDTSDLNIKVKLGILYTDVKRYRDAKGIFREILHVVPESDKVLFYLGSLCQELQEFEEAISYFSRIADTSPLFFNGNVEISKMLYVNAIPEEGKKYDGQKVHRYRKFVDNISEKYAKLRLELKFSLASFYEIQGNIDKAIDEMDSIRDHEQYKHDHDYYLASLYEKNSQFDKARDIIEVILKENPKNAHALNFLGYSYLVNGDDLDKAFVLIKRAVELKPNDGYIRDSLGWYYYKVGDFKNALKELKLAWKKEKNDVTITQHLAFVYQKLKNFRLARKFYTEALKNCKTEKERAIVTKSIKEMEEKRFPASEK